MDINKLITFEEYSKIKHDTPYFYNVSSSDGQKLYYFGERHSRDPLDTEWMQAKNFWLEFLKNTHNQKRIVFVERNKPPLMKTKEEAIFKYGGPGFITFLASQCNIDMHCPEPERAYEINELVKQFLKEEIAYFYFARSINGWNRMKEPKPEFEKYISQLLKKNETESGWSDFDFSIENMKNIHKKLFGNEFNENDLDFFKDVISPVKSETKINEIARLCSNLRNEHIVKEIQKYWNIGYSIYIHYGVGHAVMQKPVIESFILNS